LPFSAITETKSSVVHVSVELIFTKQKVRKEFQLQKENSKP